jgi:uncharacterized protein YutE (UPF0331/DUF86 family)
MQAIVGFHNVAIHGYQKLSLEVVKSVLEGPTGGEVPRNQHVGAS